ncbi:hypothetical protein ACFLRI_03635 [Bacteroidota bacterium]
MKKSIKLLHWVPRILVILAILFLSMFALDSFEEGKSFWQQIAAFLIHLIPSFVLIAFLVIAWQWEFLGGILLIITGFGLMIFFFGRGNNINIEFWKRLGTMMILFFPFALSGGLFILSHFLKKGKQDEEVNTG